MKRLQLLIGVAGLVALLALTGVGQTAVNSRPKAPASFPSGRIRPGMKGTARTVFSGSETQEFGVEVLGVLPGFPGPRQSAIIARLSGQTLKRQACLPVCRARLFTLMERSSAPSRLVFHFQKNRSAGITPIKQMIDLFNKGSGNEQTKRTTRRFFCAVGRHRLESQIYQSRPFRPFHCWRPLAPVRRLCRYWVSR